MKRALAFAVCWLAACGDPEAPLMQGYGEADYIYLAPQDGGMIAEIMVAEGDQVEAGAPVFRIDGDRLGYAAEGAAASRTALVEAAQAARAEAVLAQRNLARSTELFERGFASRAKLDADRAARDAASARADQARRQLTAAGAESGLARTRVRDLNGAAPAAGRIERVYHRAGETVAAGEPIAALLTPQNMKVRFFAPEPLLASLPPGTRVGVSCDGCTAGLIARVSFVASEPQFTPPVIYSLDERDKLVFLVEARLEQANAIRPGMPVDVRLPTAGGP